MYFITEQIRSEIYEIVTNSPMLTLAINQILGSEQSKFNFELLLIDYYNTLMIRKNMDTLDADDLKFLDLVNNSKVEDLYSLKNNYNFIKNALIASVNFETLATLDKYQITLAAYKEKDDNDLTKRGLYLLNYLAANPSNNIKELLYYYKEYISINGDDSINHDSARNIIVNHLISMKQNDFENYKLNLSTAIPVFYKWGKYILSQNKKGVDLKSRMFLRRIEKLKLVDLIELTKRDGEFLSDIITQYLYFGLLPKDIMYEVEDYSQKKLSKKMKTKFDNIDTK